MRRLWLCSVISGLRFTRGGWPRYSQCTPQNCGAGTVFPDDTLSQALTGHCHDCWLF